MNPTKTPTRYNVYIVRDKDDIAVSIIGENMLAERADRRSDTALDRINTAEYWPHAPKVGSPDDIRYAEDVKTKRAETVDKEAKEAKESEAEWL